jgi:hypothetical protein
VPRYEVYVLCNLCGGEHPMQVRVYLREGPVHKQSVAESFQATAVPPQISALRIHKTLCWKKGKTFIQEDYSKIFLTPSSFSP